MNVRRIKMKTTAMVVLLAAGIAGCSTMKPPTGEISKARTYIDAAEQDDADRYAAIALNRAKDRISQAEAAMGREEYKQAERLAEKAMADARLASATAQTEKTREALNEVNSSLDALNRELDSES